MIGPLLATTAVGSALAARALGTCGPRPASPPGSARSPPPRGLPGWSPTSAIRSPARCAARVTSCSSGSSPRSPRRAARGRERGSGRMSPPRIGPGWPSRRGSGASRLRSSTSRSRRCGRATTRTSTSITPARRCSRTDGTRGSSCRCSRSSRVLGGMDEAIAILKLCSDDWDELTVHAPLRRGRGRAVGDGADDRGRLHAFAHLETCYLGVLARRTLSRRTSAGSSTPRAASRSSSSRRATTTTAFRQATATRPTSPAPSASRPTRRPRGGAAAASAPFRTPSSPPTAGTRCSRRRSSPSRPCPT